MFPEKGWPVKGLRSCVLISVKFPCRMSAVGTEMIGLVSVSDRILSYAAMKKVRLRPS